MIDSKKSCMNNGRFEIDFTEVSKETSYCWKQENSSNIYRLFFNICHHKIYRTMIHLMKKMSAQIVIRVMVEVGVWNFGIHLFQMKIQNDYKIIKVQQRNLRCLWIRKLMKLRVCWYYAGRLSLILKIVNRILSAEAPIFGNLVLQKRRAWFYLEKYKGSILHNGCLL